MSTSEKIKNAEDAIMELSMFFVRHSLPYWPAQLMPTLQALRDSHVEVALSHWGQLPLMGDGGLMQVVVSYDAGFRARDLAAEQIHFDRLMQQALDALNNLRFYVRNGVNRPLLVIYQDTVI